MIDVRAEILAVIKKELVKPLDAARFMGPKKAIFCYLPQAGGCPSREFLDALPKEAQASYAVLMQRRCNGEMLRGETHHVWTAQGCEGLYEYKDNQSQSRLMHLTDVGQTDVLLFGFGGKKENKVETVHVNEAKRLRDEYRRRRAAIEARVVAALTKRR